MLTLFYNNITQNVKAKGPSARCLFGILKFLSFTLGPMLGRTFRKKLFPSVHKSFGGRLDLVISGGAALQKKYFNGFRLMGFNILEGYGLSETFGAVTLCPSDDPRPGSVGPAVEENGARVENPDASGIGELCFRGTNVFAGYYNNDNLTKQVFDEQGWFHTGDLARIDKDGFIYISGRIKDIIVLDSGKNVYPDELEDFYCASPAIEEIGVFSAKLKGREIAAALVVPSAEIRKNHTQNEAAEIIRSEILRLGRDLPSYKKITDFAVVFHELPRTTTKKLKKHELRELYYSIKEAKESHKAEKETVSAVEGGVMETEKYRFIASCAAKLSNRSGRATVLPHHHLELDLGIDSLKQLELVCMVERKFRILFPDKELVKIDTVGDIYAIALELLSGSAATGSADSVIDIKHQGLHE